MKIKVRWVYSEFYKGMCSLKDTYLLGYNYRVNYIIRSTKIFDDWLKSLKDLQAKGRIASRVQNLSKGLKGDVKPVGNGISEMRIFVGKGYRVYFIERGNELIILLCGGNKKSQSKDILFAKEIAEQLR